MSSDNFDWPSQCRDGTNAVVVPSWRQLGALETANNNNNNNNNDDDDDDDDNNKLATDRQCSCVRRGGPADAALALLAWAGSGTGQSGPRAHATQHRTPGMAERATTKKLPQPTWIIFLSNSDVTRVGSSILRYACDAQPIPYAHEDSRCHCNSPCSQLLKYRTQEHVKAENSNWVLRSCGLCLLAGNRRFLGRGGEPQKITRQWQKNNQTHWCDSISFELLGHVLAKCINPLEKRIGKALKQL